MMENQEYQNEMENQGTAEYQEYQRVYQEIYSQVLADRRKKKIRKAILIVLFYVALFVISAGYGVYEVISDYDPYDALPQIVIIDQM